MNYRHILLAFLCVFLTACGTVQKEYVTKTETKYIDIPESLFAKCNVTRPITREEYMKLTLQEREAELTKLTNALYKDLKNCNDAIVVIHEYQKRQQQIIKDAEKGK